MSPELRRWLHAAVTTYGQATARSGRRMDPALRAEVSALLGWLVLTPEDDLKGLEETSQTEERQTLDAGSGHVPPLTVSRTEAADLLGVSVKQIDRLTAAGRLPSVKVGRRRLIARESIESFLKEAS